MVVHDSIEQQLIGNWSVVSKNRRSPAFTCALDESYRLILFVNGRTEDSERFVHPLETGLRCKVEDDPAPAIIVGQQRRASVSVTGHLLNVPNSIEYGLGLAVAIAVPSLN